MNKKRTLPQWMRLSSTPQPPDTSEENSTSKETISSQHDRHLRNICEHEEPSSHHIIPRVPKLTLTPGMSETTVHDVSDAENIQGKEENSMKWSNVQYVSHAENALEKKNHFMKHSNLHDLSDEDNSLKEEDRSISSSANQMHSATSCDSQIDESSQGHERMHSREVKEDKTTSSGNFSGESSKHITPESDELLRNSPHMTTVTQANNGIAVPAASSTAQRKSCVYGRACYRQNPLHKQNFAHPGDDDFIEPSASQQLSNVPDTRPVCKYGKGCYRKNPQHRQDFRHDVSERSRKARPVNLTDINLEDDEDFDGSISSDDYDPSASDDSFVTSDSLGSGESDYEPTEEEEEEEAGYSNEKKRKLGEKKEMKEQKRLKRAKE